MSDKGWTWWPRGEDPYRAALVLIAVLPTLVLVLALNDGWQRLYANAKETAAERAATITEHTAKLFDTHELVLDDFNRRIHGRSWEQVADDRRLHEALGDHSRRLPQVSILLAIDAAGKVRLSSAEFPARPLDVTDRDYFQAQMLVDQGTFVSLPYVGRTTNRWVFALSRRRSDAQGAGFDGIIMVGVAVQYLTEFWRSLITNDGMAAAIVRADGMVIAREPGNKLGQLGMETLPIGGGASGWFRAVSPVDGLDRLYAYSRVGNRPVYALYSVSMASLRAAWLREATVYGLFWFMATAVVLSALGFVESRYRRERQAVAQWRETAEKLRQEIEARAQAEAAVRRMQKLEAVGQLTGGIAHDFNNLLQAAGMHLSLLEGRLTDWEAGRYAQSIREALDRGGSLVRQLLAFARKQELQPVAVDVNQLTARLRELLSRTMGGAITVETALDPACKPALADPTQLEMALLNLAINARDAMPGGGSVILRTRPVMGPLAVGEQALAAGPHVRISVADTGTGMPAEVLARAVEPFFTTKEVGRGTGLGLSMVHGFALQSGGALDISSQPGCGTEVSLYLPCAPAGAAVQPAQARPAPPVAETGALQGTILLVDDDAIVRLGTAALLRQRGFTVVDKGGGPAALAWLEEGNAVDLLLTDQAMPAMTGTELAKAVRARHPDLPILLLTGHADLPADLPDSALSGVLTKPIAAHQLVAALRDALRMAKPQRQDAGT